MLYRFSFRSFSRGGGFPNRHVISEILRSPPNSTVWKPFHHVTMNLPASSIEFTDVFRGAYAKDTERRLPLPMIHCHCFSTAEDMRSDVIARIQERIGHPLEEPILFRDVRDVAPNKRMVCISFKLPASAAYDDKGAAQATVTSEQAADSETSPPSKKPHMEESAILSA
eukprot:m.112130 g.112130  ORF g.112130 m.112130 type:complete len:169 (-) comp15316_c0_seq1:139-645(-)